MQSETKYFSQLAKREYILLSDRNIKFYHSVLRRNKTTYFISKMHTADGSTDSLDEVDE